MMLLYPSLKVKISFLLFEYWRVLEALRVHNIVLIIQVKFIEAHNFDADEDPSLRCLRILRMHLFKARSDSTGMEREASELPKEARLAYKEKQSAFVDLGVATVALTCVATHAANVEGNLADEGLELLLEMMNDGNKVVQAS